MKTKNIDDKKTADTAQAENPETAENKTLFLSEKDRLFFGRSFSFDKKLSLDIENNGYIIKNKDIKIASLDYNTEEEETTIAFQLNSESEIITPKFELYNNNYQFDYQKLAETQSDDFELKNIIIKTGGGCFIITADHNGRFNANYNQEGIKTLTLTFGKGTSFIISMRFDRDTSQFYRIFNLNREMPLWFYNPGIVYDLNDSNVNTLSFSEMKTRLNANSFNAMIRNFKPVQDFLFIDSNQAVEALYHKLKLGDINLITVYDNRVPSEQSGTFNVVKIRNGGTAEEAGFSYIDYFNDNGKNDLLKIYGRIGLMQPAAIYIDPAQMVFSDKDHYDKALCKTESRLLLYNKNIKHGFSLLNGIMKTFKGSNPSVVFFSNNLNRSLNTAFFIKNLFKENIEEVLLLTEEFYNQGYGNFGFVLNDKSINPNNTGSLKMAVLMIFCPIFFISEDMTNRLESHREMKKIFSLCLTERAGLRLYMDDALRSYADKGTVPFKPLFTGGSTDGFYSGDALFVSLIKERIFDPYFTIPEGSWYNLSDRSVIKGPCSYVNREERSIFKMLLRENSALIRIDDRSVRNSYFPDKLQIFIYPGKPSAKEKIFSYTERIISGKKTETLEHIIKISYAERGMKISYKNDRKINLNRKFIFHMVCDGIKITKIVQTGKKVLYGTGRNGQFIEFEAINRNNNLNYSLFY